MSAVGQGGGDGSGITVEEESGTPSYPNITTIQFEYSDVTNPSTNVALVTPRIASASQEGIVDLNNQNMGSGVKTFDTKIVVQLPSSAFPFELEAVQYSPPVPSTPLVGRLTAQGLSFYADRVDYPFSTSIPTLYGYLSSLLTNTTTNSLSTSNAGFDWSWEYINNPIGITYHKRAAFSLIEDSPTTNATFPTPSLISPLMAVAGDLQVENKIRVGNGGSALNGVSGTDPVGNVFTGGVATTLGSSGSLQVGIQWQDEGSNLGSSGTVTTVDFVGSIFSATRAGNKVTVTGSGAPANAQFICLATDAGLTQERTLALESGVLSGADGGAGGSYTISIVTGGLATAKYANNSVTLAKIQQASAQRLWGNPTGSPANVSEISLGTGLSFSGTTLIWTGTTGATGTLIDGSTFLSGVITVKGTGLTNGNAVLPAPANMFAGVWTPSGLTYTIPTTGRYVINGHWRGITTTAGGAGYITAMVFRNGVAIANTESMHFNPFAGANHQSSQPIYCPQTVFNAGDVITFQGQWFAGPMALAIISINAAGSTGWNFTRVNEV